MPLKPKPFLSCRTCKQLLPREAFDRSTRSRPGPNEVMTSCRACRVTSLRNPATMPMPPNPSGLCHCGCGERTTIASATRRHLGHLKGHPVRYVPGHQFSSPSPEFLVEENTGCWIWQRAKDRHGYGLAHVNRKTLPAHRMIYQRLVGPIPQGLDLDHLCRTPLCVNPEHLEPVSRAENLRRGTATKVTMQQVKEIRSLRGQMGYKGIGARYGINPHTVSTIMTRRSWKDVE